MPGTLSCATYDLAVISLVGVTLSPDSLLSSFGTLGLLFIVFAECGLLIGFFLPGDTLLFAAGVLVANNSKLLPSSIWLVCLLISAAAIAGNLVGYGIGRKAGPAVFNRPGSRLFRQEHVERTNAFFTRFGGLAIVLARFVPIVRTFITVMAGVGRMERRTYVVYSLVGGVAVGHRRDPARLLARAGRLRREQHRVDPHRDRGGVRHPYRGRAPTPASSEKLSQA